MWSVAGDLRAAEGPTITVRADRTSVPVGTPFLLEVEVKIDDTATVQSPSDPILPDEPGLKIQFRNSGMSRSMSYRNGVSRSETTRSFTYVVTARAPGRYEMLVSVDAGGRAIFARQVPVIEATGSAMDTPDGNAAPSPPAAATPSGDALEQSVFARVVTNKRRAYVGEAITAQWEVWQRVTANIDVENLPDFKDFYSVELEAGEPLEQFVKGRQWRVHPAVRRILFPQKAGRLRVGGGSLRVAPTRGFGLFARPSGQSFSVQGSPVEIEVMALPAAGQPRGFSPNNVGRATLTVTVDRKEIDAGEAFTATYQVSGVGNVKVFDVGAFETPSGVRSYPPKERMEQSVVGSELRGVRTYEILYVADTAGTVVLPAKTLHFFDPERGTYETSRAPEVVVKVRAVADEGAPGDANRGESPGADRGGSDSRAETASDVGREDDEGVLSPVAAKGPLPRGAASPSWLTPARWRRLAWTIPAVAATTTAGAWMLRRVRPSVAVQEVRARRARMRDLLDKAKQAQGVDGVTMYGVMGQIAQEAAVTRAGAQGVGLPRERLLSLLSSQGASSEAVEVLRRVLDTCDAARFGAGAADLEGGDALLQQLRDVLRDWGMM